MDSLAVANIISSTNAASAASGLGLGVAGDSSAGLNVQGAFGELLGQQIALLDPKLQGLNKLIVDGSADTQAIATKKTAEVVDFSQIQVIDPDLLIQQLAPLTVATQLKDASLEKQEKQIDNSDQEKHQIVLDAATSTLATDLSAATIVIAVGNLPPASAAIAQSTGKELPPLVLDSALSKSSVADVAKNNQLAAANEETEANVFAATLATRLGAEKSKSLDSNELVQPQVQAQHNISAQAQAANTAPVSAGIPQQVGSPHWDTGLGDKVVWMLGTNVKMAELHLNPPALGPLEVRISMADGQANLSFMTQHSAVGDAIESAKARLHQMMGESGVNMGNVSVNVGSFTQQQQQQQAQQQNSQTPTDSKSASDITWLPEGEGTLGVVTTVQSLQDRGLVDLFA